MDEKDEEIRALRLAVRDLVATINSMQKEGHRLVNVDRVLDIVTRRPEVKRALEKPV